MRKHRREAILQTPRFEEEGGGEGAPVPGTVIFHGEGNTGADIDTAACGGPHGAAGGCSLKEAAGHGDPMQKQTVASMLELTFPRLKTTV